MPVTRGVPVVLSPPHRATDDTRAHPGDWGVWGVWDGVGGVSGPVELSSGSLFPCHRLTTTAGAVLVVWRY